MPLNINYLNCFPEMMTLWIFRLVLMRTFQARSRKKRANLSKYEIKSSKIRNLKCSGAINIYTVVVILQVFVMWKSTHVLYFSMFKPKEKMRFWFFTQRLELRESKQWHFMYIWRKHCSKRKLEFKFSLHRFRILSFCYILLKSYATLA